MAEGSDDVLLPARAVALPASVSELARDALRTGARRERRVPPPVSDLEGWRRHVAEVDSSADGWVDTVMASPRLSIAVERIAGIDVYVVRRAGDAPPRARINFHIHGGAWTYFSGRRTALPAAVQAVHHGGIVHAIDYRTSTQAPFPAALDDCFAVYAELVLRFGPESILLTGESAGGNLAAALLLRARDEGLPAPAALFLNTPALDLTHSGDSVQTNRGLDVVLGEVAWSEVELYRAGADPRDPYLSPLHGNPAGAFPPTYLRTGTRDLLLSDTVRMHALLRRHGIEADLYVGEAMPHGGFAILGIDTPEDVQAREDLDRWLDVHWRR